MKYFNQIQPFMRLLYRPFSLNSRALLLGRATVEGTKKFITQSHLTLHHDFTNSGLCINPNPCLNGADKSQLAIIPRGKFIIS